MADYLTIHWDFRSLPKPPAPKSEVTFSKQNTNRKKKVYKLQAYSHIHKKWMKVCTTCSFARDNDDFSRLRKGSEKLRAACKFCDFAYKKRLRHVRSNKRYKCYQCTFRSDVEETFTNHTCLPYLISYPMLPLT
jgi:hypothetical protein